MVLILSTSEGWKAESTLEPCIGFEHRTPGLGIQRLDHKAIAPWPLLISETRNPNDVIMYVCFIYSFWHKNYFKNMQCKSD